NNNGNGNQNGMNGGLARWFEKMEFLFCISNCPVDSQVKFATCTLLDGALTWWNSHVQTVVIDEAYEMSYTRRFQELTLLCPRMVPDEEDKIESSHLSRVKMSHELTQLETMRTMKRGDMMGAYHTGHYKNDYPKLKNHNRGKQAANSATCGRAYALGGGEANPNSNIVTGTFLLNNHYAYSLFDSGADRGFVSTTFSSLIDITPTTLDVSYAIELADERIARSDTIIRGCTLNLLDQPFNIDLGYEITTCVIVYRREIVHEYPTTPSTNDSMKRCHIFLARFTERRRRQSRGEATEDLPSVRLAIRVRSLSDPTAKNKDPMIG
ncbi:hypothetical protein Tco_1050169, partial [Tanacetum coccineum]